MGYLNLAYIFRIYCNLNLIILLGDYLVSPALLELDINITLLFCFPDGNIFDDGSFENLIQKNQ